MSSLSVLMTLPPELLQKIMATLDLQTMIRLRMTCKPLYNLTAPRDAWIDMATYTTQRFHIPKPEEPLEDYTTKELEDWITHRHTVQSIWDSQEGPRFKQRRSSFPVGKSAPVLLPGGRWLLTNDKSGALYSMDLNAEKLERKRLINPGTYIEGTQILDPLTSWAYWIDPTAPRLTIRTALWSSFRYDKQTRVLIYEIQVTGHAENATLVARLLREIVRTGNATAHFVALDGQNLVQWKFGGRSDDESGNDSMHCMEVFQYEEVPASGTVEPITVKMKEASFDMYLLPHGRIVFTSREGMISIYAIPTPAQKGKTWVPLHEFRAFNEPVFIDLTSDFRSTIHHISPTCTTVLYSVKAPPNLCGITALKIPHDLSKVPSTTDMCVVGPWTFVTRVVDPFKSLTIETTSEKGRMSVSTLSWDTTAPGEVELAQVNSRHFDLPRGLFEMVYCPFGGFDPGMGRVLLYSKKYSVLEVYDTILQRS